MSKFNFTKKIQIRPHHLDKNIQHSIKTVVKKKLEGQCTQEHGYILKVLNCKIVDIMVSNATSFVDVLVSIEARCVKPRTNNIFTGRICLIFKLGILLEVANVLKVLVPFCNGFTIQGKKIPFTFTSETNTFDVHLPSKSTSLTMGELHQLKITGVQYNTTTNSYNCYGSFV